MYIREPSNPSCLHTAIHNLVPVVFGTTIPTSLYIFKNVFNTCIIGGETKQYLVGAGISDIQREASSLLHTEHIHSGDVRVFPGMRFTCEKGVVFGRSCLLCLVSLNEFTCDGSLDSLLFIVEIDTNTVMDITLWVWEPVELTNTVFVGYLRDNKTVDSTNIELVPSFLSRDDFTLYHATFQESLQFMAGGVHQSSGPAGGARTTGGLTTMY